jgi:hypothetical protein
LVKIGSETFYENLINVNFVKSPKLLFIYFTP